MSKKFIVLFMILATVLCIAVGCGGDDNKPDATAIAVTSMPTLIPEDGNDTDITIAGFDIDTIKVGDKISVFTVTGADINKNQDGTLSAGEIKFSGSLAVRGTYSISGDANNLSCYFAFTDGYEEYLPFPENVTGEFGGFYIDASKIKTLYGENTEGSAAIVIDDYSLNYNSEDGKWTASVDSFSKDESEYAIMQ